MIKSMTGFGKAECEYQNRRIIVEIKSLNSKQIDINARMPNGFRDKEIALRTILSNSLKRGKIDITITVENMDDVSNYSINKSLVRKYYNELKELTTGFEEKEFTDYLTVLMRMPEVLVPEKDEMTEDEWGFLEKTIEEAIEKVDEFRSVEGKTLEIDFQKRNKKILELLSKVEPFEKQRIENLRIKIKKDLYELANKEDIDKNRFEQELVYYLDKLDITEEKVRLKKHCEYFSDTLNEPVSQGKKLIFISQEMGREINTLGSKANEVNIQKIVVQMKDELEKIKEQLFNIL